MEVNQDQTIPEVDVLEDIVVVALEEETQETTEAGEEDPITGKVEIVTVDVVNGNTKT
jgi:hypothetical protein